MLDLEKLRKIWSLAERGTGGEIEAAKARAEAMVKPYGYTLKDIPSLLKRDRETFSSTGSHWDAETEAAARWWREVHEADVRRKEEARQKKEAEKRKEQEYRKRIRDAETAWRRANKAVVQEIIKKYGGYDAVFANTPDEQKLVDAFVERGGDKAIREAFPLPATINEAISEYRKWTDIGDERETVARYKERKKIMWDTQDEAVHKRRWLLIDLACHELPASSIEDLMLRVQFQIEQNQYDLKEQEAILKDLARVQSSLDAERRAKKESPQPAAPKPRQRKPKTASHRRNEVRQILATDEGKVMTLRQIAEKVGVSPATVMKLRREAAEKERRG